jgi:hypothetical protein
MCFSGIEDFLELLMVLNEVLVHTFEHLQLTHCIQLLVSLSPLYVIKPICWIWFRLNSSTWTSKEKSPFILIDLVVTEKDLCAQQEGEQQLVFLEEGSANILVK